MCCGHRYTGWLLALVADNRIFIIYHQTTCTKFHIYYTKLPNSIFKKTPTKCTKLKYNETYHKTHFISGDNLYILRHKEAIIREFINNKRSLLHISAIHPEHLQGTTGLVYVCSVYGNLSRIIGTLYKWSITKTCS